jgi:ABC-type transport system involved in multi-copper enzyme maturation permease subunit
MTGSTTVNLLRSEWTKLRSLRSTVWTLLATVVIMIGFGVLLGVVAVNSGEVAAEIGGNAAVAAELPMAGVLFAQLSMAVLGVLVISGEYRTGMIRTTFAAVPRRARLLSAKAAVFTAVALVTGLVASFGAFLAGQAVMAGEGLDASLGDPGVLRMVVGVALYLTVCGLLGLALGTLLRHAAGAIVTVVALLFVVPPLLRLLPGRWGDAVADHFLTNAGERILVVAPEAGELSPWAGFGVYCLWAAVLVAAALLLLRRRDV